MFTEDLFIIAKSWKQPRRPSVGQWINRGTCRQWNIIQCKKKTATKLKVHALPVRLHNLLHALQKQ